MKFIQNNIIAIVIVILLIILFFTCNKSGHNKQFNIIHSDTIIVKDTQYLPGKTIYIKVYQPISENIITPEPKVIPAPSVNIDSLKNQYLTLAEKLYTKTNYIDSVRLRDDRFKNKDLGIVYINDTISQNKIKSRDIIYKLLYPVIIDTLIVNNTIEQKKKIQVYVGLGLTGNKYQFINGINSILSLKTKKDVIYGITAGYQYSFTKVYPQFGVLVQFKIGKRK